MAHQLELTVKTTATGDGLSKIALGLRGMSDAALKSQIAIEAAQSKLNRLEAAAERSGTALSRLKADQAARELQRLQFQSSGLGQTLTSLGGHLEQIGSKLTNLARIGAGIGFTALAGAIAYSVKEAADSQKVYAQLDAVIKSTGGAAGVSAEQIRSFALEAQKVTPYTDEAVASVSNLLLTFTNIGAPVFQSATQAVLDMSTALGQDAKNGAIQLGKALQDPVTGMTALRRVGVAFNESQQDVIKSLVRTGDLLGAQRLILAEVTKEFGGSAEAAGKTFAGQLQIARNSLEEVAETIGTAILPSITELAKEFTAFLEEHDAEIKAFADRLATDVPDAIESIRGAIELAAGGAHALATGVETVSGATNDLKVEAAGLAVVLAFLFPEGALIAGLAAVLISIGIMTQDTDKASNAALNFKATWLDAIGDIYEGLKGLGATLLAKTVGFLIGAGLGGEAGRFAEKYTQKGLDILPNPVSEGYYKEADVARAKAIRNEYAAAAVEAKKVFGAPVETFLDTNKIDAATGSIKGLSGATYALSEAQAAVAITGDDSLTAIANLTDKSGNLKTGLDLVAGAAKAFSDIMAPRTFAQITLDRQIAETEALMAAYTQAGKAIPDDLQKVHDALVANRDVADKVAKAAGANFEELSAKLVQAGQDGGQVVRNLVTALDGLPEQTIVNIATELNRKSIDEVNKVLRFYAETKITIPVIMQLNTMGVVAAIESLPKMLRGPLENIIKNVTKGATGVGFGESTLHLPEGSGYNPNAPEGGGKTGGGGSAGGLSAAAKEAQQGLIDLALAFADFHEATGKSEQDFMSLIQVTKDKADLDKRAAEAITALGAAQIEATDHSFQLKKGLVEIAEYMVKTGSTITEVFRDISKKAVDSLNSAFNALFSKPTREQAQYQLQIDKLQRQKDEAELAGANQQQIDAIQEEIDQLSKRKKLLEDDAKILQDQMTLADQTLQTEKERRDAAELYIIALERESTSLKNLTDQAGLEALARFNLINAYNEHADALRNVGALPANVPAYASGIDYVPRTGLALVHRGERVVPASENRAMSVTDQPRQQTIFIEQVVITGDPQAGLQALGAGY